MKKLTPITPQRVFAPEGATPMQIAHCAVQINNAMSRGMVILTNLELTGVEEDGYKQEEVSDKVLTSDQIRERLNAIGVVSWVGLSNLLAANRQSIRLIGGCPIPAIYCQALTELVDFLTNWSSKYKKTRGAAENPKTE